MKIEELNNNKNDYAATILSATLGVVPVVGSFLSELVTQVIPNQRMDRVVNFIKGIAVELENQKIEIEELKKKIDNNYQYGAYLTRCFSNVANEMYEEKIEYYRNLCVSGLKGDEKNLIHCERLMHILCDLDFFEIQYLRYFYEPRLARTEMMNDVIEKLGFDRLYPSYTIGMDENRTREETYKQLTLNNLEKNGLLDCEVDSRYRKKYKITRLGKLILKEIGYDDIII